MKRLTLGLRGALVALLSTGALYAGDSGMHKYELMSDGSLPHPMPVLMQNQEALKLSAHQERVVFDLVSEMPAKMHGGFDKAKSIEKKILKALKEGATLKQLSPMLDELQKVKRQTTEHHLNALIRLRDVLDAPQKKTLQNLMMKAKCAKLAKKHEAKKQSASAKGCQGEDCKGKSGVKACDKKGSNAKGCDKQKCNGKGSDNAQAKAKGCL